MPHQAQREQTTALLRQHGLDRAVFANFYSLKWLTGLTWPVQVGPVIFAGAAPVLLYEDGQYTLLVSDFFEAQAAAFAGEADGEVVTFTGYSLEPRLNADVYAAETLRQQLGEVRGKVGVEVRDAPFHLAETLAAAEITPMDGWLEPLRRLKTAAELRKLRDNFALTDVGHATVCETIAAGLREIDVWAAVHAAINTAAGARIPLGNDCVVGYRQENIGGWPETYEIKADSSLIVDLSTQQHGYWSDSCATYYPLEPTAQQKKLHQTAADALELAISLVKPGVVAGDLDQRVRQYIEGQGFAAYPHHTGHGVGVSAHEAPRLVPGSEAALEAGMVIMLEPGIYLPGETSVRLEEAVLITADGAERLTRHDKSLP